MLAPYDIFSAFMKDKNLSQTIYDSSQLCNLAITNSKHASSVINLTHSLFSSLTWLFQLCSITPAAEMKPVWARANAGLDMLCKHNPSPRRPPLYYFNHFLPERQNQKAGPSYLLHFQDCCKPILWRRAGVNLP